MFQKKSILYAIFVLLLFTGCARKEERVVTFAVGGTPSELEFWKELVKEFDSQTGIKVDILRQPTDTDQRRQGLLIPLKSRKNDPDVFLMDVAWVAQFATSGWLEPLDSYIDKDGLEPEVFFSRVVDLVDRYEGSLIALPVYVDGGLLYYRKDLLKKYGFTEPPRTWNQLVDYSLKVQKDIRKINPNFYGFLWQGAQYEGLICNFLEFAASNGGGIIFKGRRILLNLPENIRAAQFMYDLIHNYRISPPNTFTEMREEQVRIFFQQGNALFERNWPYAWSLHQSEDSRVKDRVGICPLPHFPSGKSASTLGGWHVGISKFSNIKSESFEFVKFVVSCGTQKKLALELGWNPGRKDVYGDAELLKKLPYFASLREVFENAVPRPNLPYYTQISEAIQPYISRILTGKLRPEAALLSAEKEAQKVVERYAPR